MFIVGIDIGSITIGGVMCDADGEVVWTGYEYHQGMIRDCLQALLKSLPHDGSVAIVGTSGSGNFIELQKVYDDRIAAITAATTLVPGIRTLMNIGGERFSLTTFDASGNYQNLKGNTTCAAGTGSFLDQQASRLQLSGSGELAEFAMTNERDIPSIASRCSVFAKTDIIHAQQEGFALPEICDGLCYGLAKNVADTLFGDTKVSMPAMFSGGVSLNKAVAHHLSKVTGVTLTNTPNSHLYEAYGACLLAQEDGVSADSSLCPIELLKTSASETQSYYYEPLSVSGGEYPDFEAHETSKVISSVLGKRNPVEVDVYAPIDSGAIQKAYLGIDIGSTSTKAAVIDDSGVMLCGYYTRTSGDPVSAVRGIFEVLSTHMDGTGIEIRGVATTGSGRKFIGLIVGADQILDEISAHARAAYLLNPDVDTIIEIGGQDSKFTVLRNGMVTFSQMNSVCAAGTGSFIEEQAHRLGVPIDEVSDRAMGVRIPYASDRCTVFMERDINHYLNDGYSVDEVLAASLLSVRENYLLKVAVTGSIGQHICFQGATAKNQALVAAFEQKLGMSIAVSQYCHLTGALGAALTVREEHSGVSAFKGLGIWKQSIPITSERCSLCLNQCKIRIAHVEGEKIAYGFLCGRDYETDRYVSKNRSEFDPIAVRKRTANQAFGKRKRNDLTRGKIGIPKGLALVEDLNLWKYFFESIGYEVVISSSSEAAQIGKKIEGAEFCMPVAAYHGHVQSLQGMCDAVYLPIYLDATESTGKNRYVGKPKKYCYYTQFSSSLVSRIAKNAGPCIMPLIAARMGEKDIAREIHKELERAFGYCPSYAAVLASYRDAVMRQAAYTHLLSASFSTDSHIGDVKVVIVGRLYTALDTAINNGIPEIFGSLGVPVFFQDMIRFRRSSEYDELLNAVHWKQGDEIINTAASVAEEQGVYPVLLTAFKCTPDAFVIEYFERIMAEAGKPYLILQLDDHGSNVGYETRIEAAVRSFRNHMNTVQSKSAKDILPVNPIISKRYMGKTILFPNWDPVTMPLLAGSLERSGLEVRLLEETPLTIREGMRSNTGQCIPVNVIVEEAISYIDKYSLDPKQTSVWMLKSLWSCGIGMYPYYIKSLLERSGKKYGDVEVYLGELSHVEISPVVTLRAFFAYLFGGILRRLVCRIRPYECTSGATDRALELAHRCYLAACKGEMSYEEATDKAVMYFESVKIAGEQKPKVAIFGDVYVRDNDIMNQNLISEIEHFGGEVIITPYNEYVRIISGAMFKRWRKQGKYLDIATYKPILKFTEYLERKHSRYFQDLLGTQHVQAADSLEQKLEKFDIRIEHEGESFDNLLKVLHLAEEHPDISLFLQVSPAFCCPSLVTEAMAKDIERILAVPVVTITYDGTTDEKNDIIAPYIKFPRKKTNFNRLIG